MDLISNKYWMTYILVILVVVLVWISLFRYFNATKDKDGTKRKLIGISVFGPLWFGVDSYMQEHGWKLTRRETLGWISVLILMILAPIITQYLNT